MQQLHEINQARMLLSSFTKSIKLEWYSAAARGEGTGFSSNAMVGATRGDGTGFSSNAMAGATLCLKLCATGQREEIQNRAEAGGCAVFFCWGWADSRICRAIKWSGWAVAGQVRTAYGRSGATGDCLSPVSRAGREHPARRGWASPPPCSLPKLLLALPSTVLRCQLALRLWTARVA